MEPTDLTIEILKDIRDGVHKTNERLDSVNERLDATNERLDATIGGLGELRDRQTATEVRLATEIVGVAGAVREVRDLLREDRALRGRVDDHERRISAMEGRAG
jgi:hypothetical protein